MSMPKNELERLANTETNKMIEAILQGKSVDGPQNATPVNKSQQDVLDSVSKAYRDEVLGKETAK